MNTIFIRKIVLILAREKNTINQKFKQKTKETLFLVNSVFLSQDYTFPFLAINSLILAVSLFLSCAKISVDGPGLAKEKYVVAPPSHLVERGHIFPLQFTLEK